MSADTVSVTTGTLEGTHVAAQQIELQLTVVVSDETPVSSVLAGLSGRELPAVPGSWIAVARLASDCPHPRPGDDFAEVLDAEADAEAGLLDLD